MMNTQSHATFINRTLRWLLISAVVVALSLSAACAQDEPSEQEIQAAIEALDERIDTLLAIKAESDAEKEERARPTPTSSLPHLLPGTRTPAEAPMLTAVPTATTVATATPLVLPTPSGPGICGRTPHVQQAILRTLGSTSCRYVTTDELYRITNLIRSSSRDNGLSSPLKAGDLHGLVNLEELTISEPDDAPPIPAGTFAGSAVEELKLYNATLEQGTFAGANVHHLRLHNPTLQSGALDGITGLETVTIDNAESLPTIPTESSKSLKQLDIRFSEPLPDIPANYLEHLPQLRKFHLQGDLYANMDHEDIPKDDDPGRTYAVPASLFRNNQLLKAVVLSISGTHSYGSANHTVTVPNNLFETLENLEYMDISGDLTIQGYREGHPPFTLHPDSPLAFYLTPPDIPMEEWKSSHRKDDIPIWNNWKDGIRTGFSVDRRSYDDIEPE